MTGHCGSVIINNMIREITELAKPLELLSLVSERTKTYDFTTWFWGDAIAIDGLLDAAELLGDQELFDRVEQVYRVWSQRELTWVDHLTPGLGLLRVAEQSKSDWYLDTALELAQFLSDAPRAQGAPLYRPDIPMYRHMVWVDTIYHVPVFFAKLGQVTGDAQWFDKAAQELRCHVELLGSLDGPFLGHSWDTGMNRLHGYGWGRGVGWALYGFIETLEYLPKDHDQYKWALEYVRKLAAASLPVQDFTGFWHTLMQDREAYLESSTASFFAAAFARGIRNGFLGSEFQKPLAKAYDATLGRIDPRGEFWGVSACTYAGVSSMDDVAMYHTLPTEVNVWGQGSAIRAIAENIRGE